MSESRAFALLHEGVRRWVWKQGWRALRDIQERSVEPILRGDCDVVLSASTASGKTEAAFLPACSHIARLELDGIGILYISPLKALINDQYRRLQDLCDLLRLQVTPWHGDVGPSLKNRQRKKPGGVLLITPESLESLLLNQTNWIGSAFNGLRYLIIDEFHSFIGTERGRQLQSLMHRLEFLLRRTIPRIALSATLGELDRVAKCLRPNQDVPCEIIESTASKSDLKIQLRGYRSPAYPEGTDPPVFERVEDDLYAVLRGKSHLVFANTRRRTEEIAAGLADRCNRDGVPNEFFPHHGNLSKEIREGLECRLQQGKKPTTAICTMTLELGIDIGSVDSIAQVTAPHSVAGLRQRLGRSGRRGEPAVLRLFITEDEVTSRSHLRDRLRLETFQCIAMINLLLDKWYEPPQESRYHLSTLVQQTLSVIGQYGGVAAVQLWSLLCDTGPFGRIDRNLYVEFLRSLGEHDLITQTRDGQIVLGRKGERLVEHYTFYTAFKTPEEYRLEFEGRILGTVPIDNPLFEGQLVVFAGRRWEVRHVDPDNKRVVLKRAVGGKPPRFGGSGYGVHDRVRREMFRVYRDGTMPIYLDRAAKALFEEGVECFRSLGLENASVIRNERHLHILPWLGDETCHTISALLRGEGLTVDCFAGVIDVFEGQENDFVAAVEDILRKPKPTPEQLAENAADTITEKHDHFLPKRLRALGYGSRFFDIDAAWHWLRGAVTGEKTP